MYIFNAIVLIDFHVPLQKKAKLFININLKNICKYIFSEQINKYLRVNISCMIHTMVMRQITKIHSYFSFPLAFVQIFVILLFPMIPIHFFIPFSATTIDELLQFHKILESI